MLHRDHAQSMVFRLAAMLSAALIFTSPSVMSYRCENDILAGGSYTDLPPPNDTEPMLFFFRNCTVKNHLRLYLNEVNGSNYTIELHNTVVEKDFFIYGAVEEEGLRTQRTTYMSKFLMQNSLAIGRAEFSRLDLNSSTFEMINSNFTHSLKLTRLGNISSCHFLMKDAIIGDPWQPYFYGFSLATWHGKVGSRFDVNFTNVFIRLENALIASRGKAFEISEYSQGSTFWYNFTLQLYHTVLSAWSGYNAVTTSSSSNRLAIQLSERCVFAGNAIYGGFWLRLLSHSVLNVTGAHVAGSVDIDSESASVVNTSVIYHVPGYGIGDLYLRDLTSVSVVIDNSSTTLANLPLWHDPRAVTARQNSGTWWDPNRMYFDRLEIPNGGCHHVSFTDVIQPAKVNIKNAHDPKTFPTQEELRPMCLTIINSVVEWIIADNLNWTNGVLLVLNSTIGRNEKGLVVASEALRLYSLYGNSANTFRVIFDNTTMVFRNSEIVATGYGFAIREYSYGEVVYHRAIISAVNCSFITTSAFTSHAFGTFETNSNLNTPYISAPRTLELVNTTVDGDLDLVLIDVEHVDGLSGVGNRFSGSIRLFCGIPFATGIQGRCGRLAFDRIPLWADRQLAYMRLDIERFDQVSLNVRHVAFSVITLKSSGINFLSFINVTTTAVLFTDLTVNGTQTGNSFIAFTKCDLGRMQIDSLDLQQQSLLVEDSLINYLYLQNCALNHSQVFLKRNVLSSTSYTYGLRIFWDGNTRHNPMVDGLYVHIQDSAVKSRSVTYGKALEIQCLASKRHTLLNTVIFVENSTLNGSQYALLNHENSYSQPMTSTESVILLKNATLDGAVEIELLEGAMLAAVDSNFTSSLIVKSAEPIRGQFANGPGNVYINASSPFIGDLSAVSRVSFNSSLATSLSRSVPSVAELVNAVMGSFPVYRPAAIVEISSCAARLIFPQNVFRTSTLSGTFSTSRERSKTARASMTQELTPTKHADVGVENRSSRTFTKYAVDAALGTISVSSAKRASKTAVALLPPNELTTSVMAPSSASRSQTVAFYETRSTSSGTASVIARVVSPVAAEAIVGTGTVSTLAAAFVSPTAAGQAVRLSAVTGITRCSMTDLDPEPMYLEFPMRLRIGDSYVSLYVGSGFLNALLCFGLLWPGILCSRKYWQSQEVDISQVPRWLRFVQRNVAGNAGAMAITYFGPVCIKAGMLGMFHSGTAAVAMTVSAFNLLSFVVVFCLTCYVIFALVPKYTVQDGKQVVSNPAEGKGAFFFAETYGPLFDSARQPTTCHPLVRMFLFEDIVVTTALMILDTVRPGEGRCQGLAAAMMVICTAHLAYLCIVRPYRTKIEQGFSVLIALVLVGISGLALGTTLSSSATQASTERWLGMIALLESILFFVQAVVLAVWAYTVSQRCKTLRLQQQADLASQASPPSRRRRASNSQEMSSMSSISIDEGEQMTAPLLQVINPEAESEDLSSPAGPQNPLRAE